MARIETTTKQLKEQGVRIVGHDIEIHWESTGHLSVQLTDELGQAPLVDRGIKLQIPNEGLVEVVSDGDGKIFHPDVPFQEYELDLGDGVRVHVPAVANRTEVHIRHVPGVRVVFANIILFDEAGGVIPDTVVQLEGPDGQSLTATTDSIGMIYDSRPRPDGEYRLTSAAGSATIRLATRQTGISVVTLRGETTT